MNKQTAALYIKASDTVKLHLENVKNVYKEHIKKTLQYILDNPFISLEENLTIPVSNDLKSLEGKYEIRLFNNISNDIIKLYGVENEISFIVSINTKTELKHFLNLKILQTIIKWLFFCQIFNYDIA